MKITSKQLKKINSFQTEKDKFYIISLIATEKDSLIVSDMENYIIARSGIGFPTWIWTKDNLSKEKEQELLLELNAFFEKGENKFTSKKEIYELLRKYYETVNELEMGFLSCEETLKPLKGKGILVKPNYSDKVTLAEHWRNNVKEMYKKNITQWEALEEVERWLEEKRFYVLKDSVGEIVSMGGYGLVDDLAKITHIYTPPEERRKGYCQYLVYSLSKKLLEEGYKPILYTDYQYKASNKAYQNVGFKDRGILMNYSIHK